MNALALTLVLLLPAAPTWEEIAREDSWSLDELSGMVASRKHPGVLWTHNDSGNDPELFALSLDGKLLAEIDVAAKNVDWEDIALAPGDQLWICDCGNNDNERKDLRLLRVKEPDPKKPPEERHPNLVVRFRYAEQKQFPPEKARKNFDAEGLFFADGKLHLLTKHRGNNHVVLYRFDDLATDRVVTPTKIAERDLGEPPIRKLHMVTAADVSRDEKTLAVLTYGAVFLFQRRAKEPWLMQNPTRVPLDANHTGQIEALTFVRDEIWFANEDGTIFRLKKAAPPPLQRAPTAGEAAGP